jgi:hypothetical protein
LLSTTSQITDRTEALNDSNKRKYLNVQMIERFKDFGGIRIEG